jgi:hypothetical protein
VSEPTDLRQIAADDAFLDALGRGTPPAVRDDFDDALVDWRRDLDDAPPTDDRTILGAVPLAPPKRVDLSRPARTRRVAVLVAAAAIVGFLAGGVVLGANRAGPDSPLWPVAKVLYPERAEVSTAEQTIERARTAAQAGNTEEADRLLDDATRLVERINDPAIAQRLRDRIDEIRRTLLGGLGLPTGPGAGGSPGAGTPGATPAPTAPGGPTGGSTPGGGGLPLPTPSLPVPPLPLPLPLPSVPLPSLPIPPLPTLPPILPTR